MMSKENILHLSFSSDCTIFSCSTETGIRLFTTNPFLEYYNQNLNGGIKYLERLENTNTLALIGGGENPKYQKHKLYIWDDYKQSQIRELTYIDDIIAVKLLKNYIIVVFENYILLYSNQGLQLLQKLKTYNNPQAIMDVNNDQDSNQDLIFAYPQGNMGYINVINQNQKTEILIKAHSQPIQMIKLNQSGTKIATVSNKGSIVKIFDTTDGSLLQELRRGSDSAIITSMNFDQVGRFFVCGSSNGNILIFIINLTEQEKYYLMQQLQQNGEKTDQNNDFEEFKNPTSFIKKGELSIAQFKIPQKTPVVSFGPEGFSIIVITYEGVYYKACFNPYEAGQQCWIEEEEDIINQAQQNNQEYH